TGDGDMASNLFAPRREALWRWRAVLMDGLRSGGPDLTSRQLALLLSVYLVERRWSVRALASELGIGKPAVTRALDRLCGLGYLRRVKDQRDGRNVIVSRTVAGAVWLSDFGETVLRSAEGDAQSPASPIGEKEERKRLG
ncbi:MAG: MarR family transcriptional regulator, partial [Pseudomonadota bacterium]